MMQLDVPIKFPVVITDYSINSAWQQSQTCLGGSQATHPYVRMDSQFGFEEEARGSIFISGILSRYSALDNSTSPDFSPLLLKSLSLQSLLVLSITGYSVSTGMIYFPLATKELNFLFNFN